MNKYFVYFHDGYASECIGLEKFNTEEEVSNFITSRFNYSTEFDNSDLSYYTVIKGKEVEIQAAESVTKIKIV